MAGPINLKIKLMHANAMIRVLFVVNIGTILGFTTGFGPSEKWQDCRRK
jgi:hypothetical protein